MSRYISDRVLWATVIVSVGVGVVYADYILDWISDATVSPDTPRVDAHKQLQHDAANEISPNTLRVLSEAHSYEIRTAAIKIVAHRTIKSKTRLLLLRDLQSKDDARRWSALLAMRLLLYSQPLRDQNFIRLFIDEQSFYSCITALCNLLDLHKQQPGFTEDTSADAISDQLQHTDAAAAARRQHQQRQRRQISTPSSPVLASNRPAHEEPLLSILQDLLMASDPDESNSRSQLTLRALKAGLVTRWLKDYPFPCALPENSHFVFRKLDVCTLFTVPDWASDDPIMANIIQMVMASSTGKKQLRDAGLLRPSVMDSEDGSSSSSSSSSDNGSPAYYHRSHHHHSRSETHGRSGADSDTGLYPDVRMTNAESTAGATTPPEIASLLDIAMTEFSTDQMDSFIDSVDSIVNSNSNNNNNNTGTNHARPHPNMSQTEGRRRQRNREAIVVAEAGMPLTRRNILQRPEGTTFWANDYDDVVDD